MAENRKADGQDERVLQVLVVDDNRDAADSMCMLLRRWGYDCRAAYDGAEALQEAGAWAPDCLLLDLGLPRLDGYDVARRIRQRPGLERTRLVALTAYSDEEHVRRAAEAGFDFHLTKPADPTEVKRLLDMLNEVIRLAGRNEELARQNVALASETKALLKEVKQDIKEVKDEVRELKQELRDVKEGRGEGPPGEGTA